nr:hypothetical protein [Tanacetum cinerariifolium]
MFWSTARIETTDEGTNILATVDGIQRTVSKASLRRNLKLRDEDGIVSIPDTELFENLTLMGYNISQNQKLTFPKGQFSHQLKYLIHTIMQCLSSKSIGFNEFNSNIATALVCLATNRTYNFSKMIFDGMVKNVNNKGEGSGTPTGPHHTPFLEVESSHPTTSSIPLPSFPTAPIPTVTHTDTTPIKQYSRRARIAHQGEACPTESGFIADQDRATIAKSSSLPHASAPRAQKEEIGRLKERVQVLKDRETVAITQFREDAPIKGRSYNEGEAAAERIRESNFPTSSGFIPTAGPFATVISTGSEVGPTASPIVTRRKGKEVMVESDTPKKKKLQEQIDAQVKDFIPIGSKEEAERLKRKGLNLEKEQVKKQKSSEEAPETKTSTEEFTEGKIKEIMQLVPVEDVYVQALQVKHPIIDWKLWALVKEYLSIRPASSDKEMELWVELKRMYEPDPEDQLWTLSHNYMHAPVEWKLYDLSGVHHVTAKDKEIFMLVEKDYPLRRGLALVMISYRLQVENHSQMAEDLIRKIYNIANTTRN